MSDLFAAPVRPDALQASGVRISLVECDNMEPTLRSRWDYVVCVPVDTYTDEGLYLLDRGGYTQVFRVDSDLRGGLRLLSDNQRYSTHRVTRSQFESEVLAKVVADLKVRDDRALRRMAAAS